MTARVEENIVHGIPIVGSGDPTKLAEKFGKGMVESEAPSTSGRMSYRSRIGKIVAVVVNAGRVLADVLFNPKSIEGGQALWDAANQARWPAFVLRPVGPRNLVLDGNVPDELAQSCFVESRDAPCHYSESALAEAMQPAAAPVPFNRLDRMHAARHREHVRQAPATRIRGWAKQ